MGHSGDQAFPVVLRTLPWLCLLLVQSALAQADGSAVPVLWPESSGVRVELLSTLDSPSQVKGKKSWFNRFVSFLIGPESEDPSLIRPLSVVADGGGRIIVADPGVPGVHIFDLPRKRYRLLSKGKREAFQFPVAVVLDPVGHIYISDSKLGKIFVFDRGGEFRRVMGEFGGESMFRRPTGLAVDPGTRNLYVTDTLRHRVYVLDLEGQVLRQWGERGKGEGQFNYPTALAWMDDRVFVLDALNYRVQTFDRQGNFLYSFGGVGLSPGRFFRPKGLAVDLSRRLVYVSDGLADVVQVFDDGGELLLAFGGRGKEGGLFQLVSGLFVDAESKILVADSVNRRVQVMRHGHLESLTEHHGSR